MTRTAPHTAAESMRCRSIRRGFTLIEVVVAITLTAIVLAIAAAALGAATSARARIETHQHSLEADSRMRALLSDMLRHAPAGDAVNEPMLRIERDGPGEPTLVFLSTGVREPFGTGAPWRVTVRQDSTTLIVDALPLGRTASAAPLHMTLSDVTDFDVRVDNECR